MAHSINKLLLIISIIITIIAHLSLADKVERITEEENNNFNFKSPFGALIQHSGKPLIQHKSQRRDLGLIAIKAILLGPLIGLTIKAALVRGLIWALVAYGLHLFFPAVLSFLGLGSGLVGFARQIRPDYTQMLATYFLNLIQTLPGQYHHIIAPIIESIRSIPEGHCRYRAVCEIASHMIRNVRSMSSSLQRISATVYMNFGTDYSRAWLDGIVQSDCAIKYAQCTTSPFSHVAARLAQSLR